MFIDINSSYCSCCGIDYNLMLNVEAPSFFETTPRSELTERKGL